MSKVVSKVLWWSAVNDAAEYRVRIARAGTEFTYELAPLAVVAHAAGQAEFELDLGKQNIAEGTYGVFITAVDAAGNESDPFALAGLNLDFNPPAAPANGGIR
jgi:hypothetical protein